MACDNVPTAEEIAILKQDAGTINEVVTSTSELTAPASDGNQKLTLKGVESKYIMSAINGGVWAVGIDFTAYNQYMIYNGVAYKPKSATVLPYTSEATPNVANVEPFSDINSGNIGQYTQGKNLLINGNLSTTIINQRVFGGGQPANGVYGFDRWKGEGGVNIEQVIENTDVINDSFVLSWVGVGSATVNGVAVSNGAPFTLNTSGNFSVIITTGATFIQLERGTRSTAFESIDFGTELARCQRYYEKSYSYPTAPGTYPTAVGRIEVKVTSTEFVQWGVYVSYKATKRAGPTITTYSPTTGASGQIRIGTNDVASSIANFGDGGFFGKAAAPVSETVNNDVNYHWTAEAEL